MARAKGGGASVNLDSFLDIMTCLVGVLVLIIILTGLDAATIQVVIPTPMEYDTEKRPIFIEARNNELFRVPVTELQAEVDVAMRRLRDEAAGNRDRLFQMMQDLDLEYEGFRVDLSYFLMGQFGILPVEETPGYALRDWNRETARDWFGSILANMDTEEEFLSFIVRDDSFEVFKIARHLAWLADAHVGYELVPREEPIRFGASGLRVRPM